ncbi:MAG: MarC family protein [Pseudomonadota bacterium]
MIDTAEYIKLLIALLAIVDVPGNVPMFLQQTQKMSTAGKLLAALTAGVATAAILLLFAFFGHAVLDAFGITLPAFKILGGVVIFLIALEMLGLRPGGHSDAHGGHQTNPVVVGIFPMAVPLFAGPGTISAVMVYSHEEFHSDHDLIIMLLIVTVSAAIVIGMAGASAVSRLISPLTQDIMNRLLGMIVGALGIEFILEGIGAFFPELRGIR